MGFISKDDKASGHESAPPQVDEQASGDITLLLHAWNEGDRTALDKLSPIVYAELRRLAQH